MAATKGPLRTGSTSGRECLRPLLLLRLLLPACSLLCTGAHATSSHSHSSGSGSRDQSSAKYPFPVVLWPRLRGHTNGLPQQLRRPGRFQHAKTARWLVASQSWGVVSTKSVHLGGSPFGNVASFSDLIDGLSSGTPYFYLTKLDPTALDASVDPTCSLTLSEQPLGTCGSIDPENPLCAKVTITGSLEELVKGTGEHDLALKGLFAKHPEMARWPSDHKFHVFALRPTNIFIIDFFGGPKPVTVQQYFDAAPDVEVQR